MGETTLYVVAARGREVDMTGAQGWTLLGLVGVLISVIGAMMINQFQLLRAYLDARFTAVDARFTAVDARFTAVDVRFDAVDKRFDNLDRDVQAVAAALFRRD